jgi:hypothetical protein
MNKRRRFTGALLLVVMWRSGSRAAEENPAPLPFAPGETLTYDVDWSIFPAGKVVASLPAGREKPGSPYEVKTTARSQGFVSLLYNVQDEYNSFFDPRTLCSDRIVKTVNEGRRHKQTEIVFNYARGLALLDERDPTKPDAPTKHDENAIPGCAEDVLSAFYFLRRQPLEIGKSIRLEVNDGSRTQQVIVEVQAREQIQTSLGNMAAIRVEPRVFGQLIPRKGRMLIWFSEDPKRLPLRIKMMISVGTITGNLVSVTTASGSHPSP